MRVKDKFLSALGLVSLEKYETLERVTRNKMMSLTIQEKTYMESLINMSQDLVKFKNELKEMRNYKDLYEHTEGELTELKKTDLVKDLERLKGLFNDSEKMKKCSFNLISNQDQEIKRYKDLYERTEEELTELKKSLTEGRYV